jgi:acetolactate synthase-1/2/3 large subunit
MSIKSTTAEAYVKYLLERNVKTIFCIPGGALYPLLDVLHDSSISLIAMGHEQSLVHAAEGYSFVSRTPSVVMVTSGPGATNALTGVANAKFDHHPVVVIVGQVPTQFIGKRSFQEINIVSAAQGFSKLCIEAATSDEAISFLHDAFEESSSIPFGPALVSVPSDLWNQKVKSVSFSQDKQREHDDDLSQLTEAIDILNNSKRPLLLIGQGVNKQDIYLDLKEFSSNNSFPVASTLHALGAFPMESPYWLGMVGTYGSRRANFAASYCDTLLILGASLNERVTGNPKEFAPHATTVHIDINPRNLGRFIETDLKICSRIETFISAIKRDVKADKRLRSQRITWLNSLLQEADSRTELGYQVAGGKKFAIIELFETINPFIKYDQVVVTDCGQHQLWAAQFLDLKRPNQLLTTGGFGTMGFGLPAAIGASLADPSRLIWCLVGDGGLLSSLQELAVLKEFRCNIKIIIFNNSGFGMVRQAQDMFYQQRRTLSDLRREWSFEDIGKAFGIYSKRVATPYELKNALESCPPSEPVLIEVLINEDLNVHPMIQPGKSTSDLLPNE